MTKIDVGDLLLGLVLITCLVLSLSAFVVLLMSLYSGGPTLDICYSPSC